MKNKTFMKKYCYRFAKACHHKHNDIYNHIATEKNTKVTFAYNQFTSYSLDLVSNIIGI